MGSRKVWSFSCSVCIASRSAASRPPSSLLLWPSYDTLDSIQESQALNLRCSCSRRYRHNNSLVYWALYESQHWCCCCLATFRILELLWQAKEVQHNVLCFKNVIHISQANVFVVTFESSFELERWNASACFANQHNANHGCCKLEPKISRYPLSLQTKLQLPLLFEYINCVWMLKVRSEDCRSCNADTS